MRPQDRCRSNMRWRSRRRWRQVCTTRTSNAGENGQPLEIVHRDISPSNVLISFSGAVRVTDFGVAKWAEQRSFTHHGQLKGKFAHMSPEQCRGEPLDRRSDVFALGTLLYEMITGAPPFVAESEYELLTQIVSRDAPPPNARGVTSRPSWRSSS